MVAFQIDHFFRSRGGEPIALGPTTGDKIINILVSNFCFLGSSHNFGFKRNGGFEETKCKKRGSRHTSRLGHMTCYWFGRRWCRLGCVTSRLVLAMSGGIE